ncbi:hypothetical protein PI124_g22693 [Phytophthora idaei]|nr:hypothetical protein PI124_g22693 [Phytophthora idaei]
MLVASSRTLNSSLLLDKLPVLHRRLIGDLFLLSLRHTRPESYTEPELNTRSELFDLGEVGGVTKNSVVDGGGDVGRGTNAIPLLESSSWSLLDDDAGSFRLIAADDDDAGDDIPRT